VKCPAIRSRSLINNACSSIVKLSLMTRVCCTDEGVDVVLPGELLHPNGHMSPQFGLSPPYLESFFYTLSAQQLTRGRANRHPGLIERSATCDRELSTVRRAPRIPKDD
jgi:hypothetical protein